MLPHQLELLAPARTADIGIEAVNHGADAVYIGGPSFGARSSADNTVADLERLARHAHRFHSRVFVTLNTILRDDELEPARRLAWQLYEAGVDALIIQDMGLLELDLPPLQLHGSTQTDIRTPDKARFLQDVGLSKLVLARELTLPQIADIAQVMDPQRCLLEFFIHGALCVAYSGQCYISHAHTGRSANRGDCSQACRLPYEVRDAQDRIVAHDKHVLSMKDNNQSENLRALIDVGIRSFKIEGRYKDMGYVKNITAHYRQLFDEILNERPDLAPASQGRCAFTFQPDPLQNFNREFTDYFVNGRQADIGAFDSPKNPGQAIGWISRVFADHLELTCDDPQTVLHNGDGLCFYDPQQTLVGLSINRAQATDAPGVWLLFPKDPLSSFTGLKAGLVVNRNRDMSWVRVLDKPSADRRIGVWMQWQELDDGQGFRLRVLDEAGFEGEAIRLQAWQAPKQPDQALANLEQHLSKLGETCFAFQGLTVHWSRPWFVPASQLNALRREAMAALEAARSQGLSRLPRGEAVEPPVAYPEDTLSYLANVYNHKAHDFYRKHGVQVIEPAYEAMQETDEVSLMITKHCVRFSLSLCPKQAKGVTGVQGTVKAEPMHLINGKERLTLHFDCKPCEMHVRGKLKPSVLRSVPASPLTFYKTRPSA